MKKIVLFFGFVFLHFYLLESQSYEIVHHNPEFSGMIVFEDQVMYFGEKIMCFNKEGEFIKEIPMNSKFKHIDQIIIDANNKIWLMDRTQIALLSKNEIKLQYEYSNNKKNHYRYFHNLVAHPEGGVYCYTTDGIMAIKENAEVVSYYQNAEMFSFFDTPNRSFNRQAFAIDNKGTVFFAVGKSYYSLDKDKNLHEFEEVPKRENAQFFLSEEHKVYGRFGSFLVEFSKDSIGSQFEIEHPEKNRIMDIHIKSINDFWTVGSAGTVEHYHNKVYQGPIRNTDQQQRMYFLGYPYIKNIFGTSDGKLWLNFQRSASKQQYFISTDSIRLLETKEWNPKREFPYYSHEELVDKEGVFLYQKGKKEYLFKLDSITAAKRFKSDLYIVRNGKLLKCNLASSNVIDQTHLLRGLKRKTSRILDKASKFAVVGKTLFLSDGNKGLYYFSKKEWSFLTLDQITTIKGVGDRLYIFSNSNIIVSNERLNKFDEVQNLDLNQPGFARIDLVNEDLLVLYHSYAQIELIKNGKFISLALPKVVVNQSLNHVALDSNGDLQFYFERTLLRFGKHLF